MNKLIYFTFSSILVLLMFITLTNPSLIIHSVLNSTNTFIKTLFPTLFPFYIISYFLINYNVIYNITSFISKYTKINTNILIILFLSILSGYPSNAKYINELFINDIISEEDAEKLTYITFFPGPMYVLGTIGSIYLNNYKISLIILISIYITNIFLLSKVKLTKSNNFKKKINYNIGNHIKESISSSINTLLIIMGSIIIFTTILNIINYYLNLPVYINLLINSFLEMSSSIINISNLLNNLYLKTILISLTLTFGGLCIHFQMISIISYKIKYSILLKYRVLSLIINFIILNILTCLT